MVTQDGYGRLLPLAPKTRLFESSVERQRRQAVELVRAQAEVVRVAEQCRAQLAAQAIGNVTNLVALGERLAALNPSAAGQIEQLVTAYTIGAYNRIAWFS